MRVLACFLSFIFVASTATASVAYVETQQYKCSNGQSYDVAIQYWGGWGPGSWQVRAFCQAGILTESSYNGRFMEIESAHVDLQDCVADKDKGAYVCMHEYARFNELKGNGEIPQVISPNE